MTKLIKHRINALEIENAELRNATSLRDEFAMAALTGLASAVGTPPSIAAIEAYAFADAMLIERERRDKEKALAKEYYDNMLTSAVGTPPSIAAIEAYAFADAMLKTIEDTLQEQINVKSMVD